MRGGEERRGFATWGADAVPFVVGTRVARDRDSSHTYRGIGIVNSHIGGCTPRPQEKRKQKANAHQAKVKGGNCANV